jgi:hypothetical protein
MCCIRNRKDLTIIGQVFFCAGLAAPVRRAQTPDTKKTAACFQVAVAGMGSGSVAACLCSPLPQMTFP